MSPATSRTVPGNLPNLFLGFSETGTAGYRYAFNGMERDDEVKGSANSLDFGARIYDPRLGRWSSVDPLAQEQQGISAYAFVNNRPVLFLDADGRILTIGGDRQKAIADLRSVLPEKYQSRLKVAKDGTVRLRMSDRKLKKLNDVGLNAVSSLIKSEHKYLYEAATGDVTYSQRSNGMGDHVPPKTEGDGYEIVTRDLNDPEDVGIINWSNLSAYQDGIVKVLDPDWSGSIFEDAFKDVYSYFDEKTSDPNIDHHLAIGTKKSYYDTEGNNVTRNVILHEVLEAFFRTDKKQQYEEAHMNAMNEVAGKLKEDDPRYAKTPGLYEEWQTK